MTQEVFEATTPNCLTMTIIYCIISIVYMWYKVNNDERYKADKEDLEDYVHYYAIVLAGPIFIIAMLIVKVLKHFKLNNKQIKK